MTERSKILCNYRVASGDGCFAQERQYAGVLLLQGFDDLSVHARGVMWSTEIDKAEQGRQILPDGQRNDICHGIVVDFDVVDSAVGRAQVVLNAALGT